MVKKISQLTPFGLRIPEDLKEQLESDAKKKGRSLNKEITACLEACVSGYVDLSSVSTEDLVRELIKRNEPGRILIEITPPE